MRVSDFFSLDSFGALFRQNWQSGLTVALISIPLSLSLALASGATILQGILTAIWAGLVYSFFAGSKYNVVGPAGALSGILVIFAFSHGAAALPLLAIITGVFIFIAYLFHLERYLVFVPASSLHGFTLGVALTIGLGQLNSILGLSGLPKHEKLFANIVESIRHIGQTSPETAGLFLIFLAGMFAFARWMPKIPGAVVLAPIGIVIGELSSRGVIPWSLQTVHSTYGDITMKFFERPDFSWSDGLITTALAVALVAILETLISAKIADGMAHTTEKYNRRKEMRALAIANIGSGLMGGIPATGVFARTALNVKTGATSRFACGVQSIFVAAISLFLLKYFQFIPLAVVASILVFAAVRMVEIHHYKRSFSVDKRDFWIILVVAFLTVYEDPIAGIMFGTAVSLVFLVEKLSRGQFELVLNRRDEAERHIGSVVGEQGHIVSEQEDEEKKLCHTLVYSIKGQLAYLNAQAHIERFENKLTDYEQVILRCRELYFIDVDGVSAFDEIVDIVERQGKKVYVSGVSTFVESVLKHSRNYQRLVSEGKVFVKTTVALSALGYGTVQYEEKTIG
jgi:SulP family sulfate permease